MTLSSPLREVGPALASVERPQVEPLVLREFGPRRSGADAPVAASDAQVELRIELGRAWLEANRAVALRPGTIVALDKGAAEGVEIYAAGKLVARGELVVVQGVFCVRITQGVAAKTAT